MNSVSAPLSTSNSNTQTANQAPSPTPPLSSSTGSCSSDCEADTQDNGPAITPESEVAQRSPQDDAEYHENYIAAEYINALFALENNWVGQGVTVGVMDDGIMVSRDLEGKVNTSGLGCAWHSNVGMI